MPIISTTEATKPYGSVRTVSAEALLQEIRSEVALTIVDVRDRAHIRATGVIAGARIFPLPELGARVAELADRRATPLVVVSQRGLRAEAAVVELQAAGFTEVVLLEGGIHRWLELGYPVEPRPDSIPSSRL